MMIGILGYIVAVVCVFYIGWHEGSRGMKRLFIDALNRANLDLDTIERIITALENKGEKAE